MKDDLAIRTLFIIIAIFTAIFAIWGCFALGQVYGVWSAGMNGKAELAQADWNRQIAVREAQAKEEAASMLAQADIQRAYGVAKANKIIGDSLKKNEDYLKYLWIQNIETSKNQIIYVPTETNLPILEAGRIKK